MTVPHTRKEWLRFGVIWAGAVGLLYAGLKIAQLVAPHLASAMAAGIAAL